MKIPSKIYIKSVEKGGLKVGNTYIVDIKTGKITPKSTNNNKSVKINKLQNKPANTNKGCGCN